MPDSSQNFTAGAPSVAAQAAPFRCSAFTQGIEATWVKAEGDLDLAGAPELEGALRDALASAQLVVLDLSELSFIDLLGVRVIVDASVRAGQDGRRLMVALAPAHVERTFSLSGMAEAIERLELNTNDPSTASRLRLVD